jgi:hypothetical protein
VRRWVLLTWTVFQYDDRRTRVFYERDDADIREGLEPGGLVDVWWARSTDPANNFRIAHLGGPVLATYETRPGHREVLGRVGAVRARRRPGSVYRPLCSSFGRPVLQLHENAFRRGPRARGAGCHLAGQRLLVDRLAGDAVRRRWACGRSRMARMNKVWALLKAPTALSAPHPRRIDQLSDDADRDPYHWPSAPRQIRQRVRIAVAVRPNAPRCGRARAERPRSVRPASGVRASVGTH